MAKDLLDLKNVLYTVNHAEFGVWENTWITLKFITLYQIVEKSFADTVTLFLDSNKKINKFMKAKEIFNENYFPRDDNYSKADGHGDRKPHLTLSHLNRLRKIKEKKAEDTEERMKTLQTIYNPPQPEA